MGEKDKESNCRYKDKRTCETSYSLSDVITNECYMIKSIKRKSIMQISLI